MKFTNNNFHQGDTQWFSLESLPNNLNKVEKQFIAASERSGSFHALFGNYEMYKHESGFVLDVKEECVLNHSLKQYLDMEGMDTKVVLPKKDHRHTIVPSGIYFVGIQQRFDPLENIKKRVID